MKETNEVDIYIEDPDGKYQAWNGTKRYKRITGSESFDYLRTEEGKSKNYMQPARRELGDPFTYLEIPPEELPAARKDMDRARYVRKNDQLYATISIYGGEQDTDSEVINGEELIEDKTVDVENVEMQEMLFQKLREAISLLSAAEAHLIFALFLCNHCLTEEEYAREMGVSQQAISKKKKRILKKMKKIINSGL